MDRRFLKRLTSKKRGIRLAAWSELNSQPETADNRISMQNRHMLAEIVRHEPEASVRLHAMSQMIGFGDLPNQSAVSVSSKHGHATLDEWFLAHFANASVVLGVRDQKSARRDELALVHLARRFSLDGFPKTEFEVVPLGDSSWQLLIEDRHHVSILAVGRLALYGKEATKLLPSRQLRFGFPSIPRPPIAVGELHSDYHQIIETNPDNNQNPDPIRPEDNNGIRTDYAIVQLYPIIYGGRQKTTMGVCAGCTSLGTLGAARWLANDLGREYNKSDGTKITMPAHAQFESRLEVLLRVSADLRVDHYHPISTEVCRIFLDDSKWCPESNTWSSTHNNTLALIKSNGCIQEMILNGSRLNFRKESQNSRIATFMFEAMAATRFNRIKLSDIQDNLQIWDGRRQKLETIRRKLHNLKNNMLQGSLDVRDDNVYFLGTINIEKPAIAKKHA